MSKEYDIAVFIGRFQPFHNGHQRVIDFALTKAKYVLVLVGSANRAPNTRNPWSFEHREKMIRSVYQDQSRIFIRGLDDVMYNDDKWIEQVQSKVNTAIYEIINSDTHSSVNLHGYKDASVTLVGCEKDSTSYYLKLFPTWGSVGVEFLDPINATDLREDYFSGKDDWERFVAIPTVHYLKWFKSLPQFKELQEHKKFISEYKENVKKYPRIEQTTDAIVTQSGHILLIKRKSNPGKGLWALPGGFLNPEETLLNGSIRELREETRLKVPEKVLKGSIKKSKTFDDPNRSERGRLITQAFHFELEPQIELPKVRGSDDAEKARWIPLSELKPELLFEDHFFIIQDILGNA